MSYGETREYLQSWVEKVHNNKTTLRYWVSILWKWEVFPLKRVQLSLMSEGDPKNDQSNTN